MQLSFCQGWFYEFPELVENVRKGQYQAAHQYYREPHAELPRDHGALHFEVDALHAKGIPQVERFAYFANNAIGRKAVLCRTQQNLFDNEFVIDARHHGANRYGQHTPEQMASENLQVIYEGHFSTFPVRFSF